MIAIRKPLPYYIALALAALTHTGASQASEWNCVAKDPNGWSCNAADVIQTKSAPAVIAPSATSAVSPAPAKPVIPATTLAQPNIAEPSTVSQLATAQRVEAQSSEVQKPEPQSPALAKTLQTSTPVTTSVSSSVKTETAPTSTVLPAPATPVTGLAPEDVRSKNLDWVAVNDPDNCCGGEYQAPELPVYGDEDLESPPIYFAAGQTEATLGGVAKHRDGVHLRQGKQHLAAAQSDVDQSAEKARFDGDVTYREPGAVIVSESAHFDLTNKSAVFQNAQFAMHNEHVRGDASEITRNPDATITLVDGEYTYCPPGHEDWMIKAASIDLDNETGWGLAKHARLNIGPVPVLYAPFLTFPIDDRRMSGLLYPTVSFTDNNGWDMSLPYYFNLAENYDDTLTVRNISERGVMLENEFRHLGPRFSSSLSTSFMPDDSKSDDSRWLASVKQSGNPTTNTTSNIDYTVVSDSSYFDDLGTSLSVERESHIDQQANITYHGTGWALSGELHGYQTITADEKPYEKLPQIRLTGDTSVSDNTQFNYLAEYTYFDRDISDFTGADRVTGSRIHLAPSLSYHRSSAWGFVKPKAKLWATQYALNDQETGLDSSPNYAVPVLSIDSGLYFDRTLASGGTHSLEPRLFALYVPDVSQSDAPDFDASSFDFGYQSLFRDNRFSGKDRIGDAQQVSLGLTNRFSNAQGLDQAYISLGQAYYFDDYTSDVDSTTQYTGSTSDIAMQSAWYYSQKTRLTLDNVFARSNGEVTTTSFKISHEDGLDKRVSLQYIYDEDEHEQTDLQFIWPISQKWATIGRWNYDLEDNNDIERLFGLEYESCCWRVQAFARHWLEDDDEFNQGVFLRFVLKGLGSIGSPSEFLDDVTGYTKREEHDEY